MAAEAGEAAATVDATLEAVAAEEGAGESTARARRQGDAEEELEELENMKKVGSAWLFAKKLERTQLQKMRDGPLKRVAIATRKHSFTRRSKLKRQQKQGLEEVEDNSLKKNHRKSWVVGEFGGEEVKDRHKADREELTNLHSLGVVRERLKEGEKVREQAMKFFKHRYELPPESTQKSSCILVTGMEPEQQTSAADYIRQQSTFVISKMFDQPQEPAVFSRLTSDQRDSLEQVVGGDRSGRGHKHSMSEPHPSEMVVNGWGSGRGFQLQRGKSVDERGRTEANERRHGDDSHMIGAAMSIPQSHTHTLSEPHPPTPQATPTPPTTAPPLLSDGTASAVPSAVATPTSEPISSEADSDQWKEGVAGITSSPRRLERSPSYTLAMESDDIVTMATEEKSEKSESKQQSPKQKSKGLKRSLKFGKLRILPKLNTLRSEKKTAATANHVTSDPGIIRADATVKEGVGLANDVIEKSAVVEAMVCEGERDEDMAEEDSDNEPPKPKPRRLAPSRPPHKRLSPQFSITSLPGPEGGRNTRYYTSRRSPHINTMTAAAAAERNPFAEDFDRAMHKEPQSGTVPTVTRSNTYQLPEDVLEDEGFMKFLEEQDAKPSTSLYITYQIQLISHQIDRKYGNQLNQALDDIIYDVVAKQVTWENFSAVCKSLLFKGDGLREGLFMVPAFGRRLLGFLPEMRGVIMQYTQAVFEKYAMDWLLMRGGWGELLYHFEQEGMEGRWVMRGVGSEEETHCPRLMEEEEEDEDEMFDTAIGYGLVTPAPEKQNLSLASLAAAGVHISDVGYVVDQQVSFHADKPHPQETADNISMGSQLFLAPIQEMAPPIGRGLRRVNSVEVLFITSDETFCHGPLHRVAMVTKSLDRVSSLPSLSSLSSVPSPSTPISIPSRGHKSTDRSSMSSGIGTSPSLSPSIFTLPSLRDAAGRKPRPLYSGDSVYSPSSPSLRTQSLTDSSVRIVMAGVSSTPSPFPSSSDPRRPPSEPSNLATYSLLSQQQQQYHTGGCGQTTPQTTPPPHNTRDDTSEAPPTNQAQRSASSDSYVDYGLDSENGNVTELEQDLLFLALALGIAAGLGLVSYIIMS